MRNKYQKLCQQNEDISTKYQKLIESMNEKKQGGERRGSLKQKLKIDLTKVKRDELMSPRKAEGVSLVEEYQPNYEEIGQSLVQECRNEINESFASVIQQQEDLFVTRRGNDTVDQKKNLGNETFLGGVENQSIIESIINQSAMYEDNPRQHRESVATTATAQFQPNNNENMIKDTIERIFSQMIQKQKDHEEDEKKVQDLRVQQMMESIKQYQL